ncbi:class I SAM-dependent methyltransferase [Pseudothauera rhizosphaerae]|uniref:Class I SAM-dependent methyltransferase n=1 Tax=Pseudothauera rhizosphaerae TaxID=2565932 RepID=A0A4S4AWW9_9RHOO|nr:class I SAM-dependent methyltransferase [Pseudothauera rhizosphaerae]THF64143.1 class I SAM-dependent methyltransferase [Pseudothauera rhizosphaerae]
MNAVQALLAKTHYQRLEERCLERLFATRFNGKSLLDIGCGQGKYLRLLSVYCPRLTGVDANPEQVDALRQEGFGVSLPEELSLRKYDILLMSHIVEHLSAKDLVAFMDKYLPMLEDDGRLIVITPMPGIRFWHDYTHVRPYTPQSLGMMFGILGGPVAFRPRIKMVLEEAWFFRDSWRLRNNRYYFPPPPGDAGSGARHFRCLILIVNVVLAGLHVISGGRLGKLASWMGVYRRTDIAESR